MRRGAKLALRIILDTDRLPSIVQNFLRQAEILRKLIEKATREIVEDMKTMLYDHEISRWLGSDKMTLQGRYHSRLQDLRNDEACEFLVTHPQFQRWYYAPGSEWLALLGNMGCGKTVAMTYLVDELHRRNEHQLPQPKICYHYCRDDETGQAVYVFSALILALLEQLSGLKKQFYEWYKQQQASGVLEPATNARKLGEFLEMLFETLDRPLFIVIDGLDECNRASRRALFQMLRKLSQNNPRLKIAISSRPEEEILLQLDGMMKIDLTQDNYRDEKIIQHTVEKQLYYLSDDIKSLVIERLSRQTQGSAIWTKMIIELIEVRGIRAPGPMQLLLDQMPLPEQLSDLYAAIISRCASNDPENKEIAIVALKIVAGACRPLSIQELAWAVALATARQKISAVASLAELIDHQRVLSLIYVFITRIDFDDVNKRQVQLVHQSVKEFVIRDLPVLYDSGKSKRHTQTDARQQSEDLDAFMAELCVKYLLLNEIGSCHLFSEEQVAIEELPQEVDLFEDSAPFDYNQNCTWEVWEENMIRYDPNERGFGQFFIYAASHWSNHFGFVQSGSLTWLTQLEVLCQAGSIRLHNWISQNCRPGCAIKPRFEFESHLYDPLSITALYGSEGMLRAMLENSTFDEANYLPSTALAAADQVLQWGDLSRLRILLLKGELTHQLQNLDFFRLIIRNWSDRGVRHNNWDPAFDLVGDMVDALVEQQWGNQLLCLATRTGCTPIIQRLLALANSHTNLKTELLPELPSIAEAPSDPHIGVVKCPSEQEGFNARLGFLGLPRRKLPIQGLRKVQSRNVMLRLLVPHFQEHFHRAQTNDEIHHHHQTITNRL